MSTLETPERGLVETAPLGQAGSELLALWLRRREQARSVRRRYEPTWAVCEQFVAGRQWVGWAPQGRNAGRIVTEPNPSKRERHTVNVITTHLQTVLGKMFVEDLRPTVVFTRDDAESEAVTKHTRALARYLWDVELAADECLYRMLHNMLVYGTSALRCFFDTQKGQELGQFPIGPDGQAIVDPAEARAFVAQQAQVGVRVPFVPLREGRVQLEVLSPRQLLTPPGVIDAGQFPWLMVERAMPVEWARMKYPNASKKIDEDSLAPYEALSMAPDALELEGNMVPADAGRLREHVLVTTGYQLPTLEHPGGRTVTFIASQQNLLDVQDSLPYKLRSEPHHGIIFFHYHRLPHRFLSKGLVEDLIGPQRQKNRARSQMIEMKDRNLGRVYAKKGSITPANRPTGKIMELIEVALHADYPMETQGVPPGPWIESEARINDEDMALVAGLRDVTMGSGPAGISAYSALALLAEQDERRLGPTMKMIRIGIGDMMVLALELARRYWIEPKQMGIAGPDGDMELVMFQRNQLPIEFNVDVSRHAPLPTSPAVESQKIFDIYHAATSSGQPLPIEWLKSSLDNGRALPIPRREDQVQMGKAQMENVLLAQGQQILIPDYYDDDWIHISVHREAQVEHFARPEVQQAIEQHIQMHAQNMALKRPTAGGGQVPQMQGGHGIEAQNGPSINAQGAAQTAAGDAPLQSPGPTPPS